MSTSVRLSLLPTFLLLCLFLVVPGPGCSSGPGGRGDDDDDQGDDDAGSDDDDVSGDPCEGVATVSGTSIALEEVATGLFAPVFVTHAGDGTGRLFVVEQGGTIVALAEDGSKSTWLDIDSSVTVGSVPSGDERGLLALAFHPDFSTNGRFFVHYSGSGGATTVSEFQVKGDPLTALPSAGTERVLLTANQPASNHNGGQIAFGPDGYLYIGLGDGGGAGDTFSNGQNRGTLLAKILRIDVDGGDPYEIPADNPFVNDSSFPPEAWAWGLRNPWRFSFDRETGLMWIGDVGQNSYEEIDVGVAGANYGWPEMEGNHCYAGGCDPSLYEAAVFEYEQPTGRSVTGGYVYRGCVMPDVLGLYFYSDYNYFDSPIWSLQWDGEAATSGPATINSTGSLISSFGEDEQGEIYVCDHTGGRLLKLVPATR
ncbi:MAG: glucose dehydrogenase [Deltaproteobacteria bacterium]|nr:glucose dehydrogenase [Deltaproteobacteria bacterium]